MSRESAAAAIKRGLEADRDRIINTRNEEIRRRHAAGESQASLAGEYGISGQRVSQIVAEPRAAEALTKASAFDRAVAEGLIPADYGSDNGDGGAS